MQMASCFWEAHCQLALKKVGVSGMQLLQGKLAACLPVAAPKTWAKFEAVAIKLLPSGPAADAEVAALKLVQQAVHEQRGLCCPTTLLDSIEAGYQSKPILALITRQGPASDSHTAAALCCGYFGCLQLINRHHMA